MEDPLLPYFSGRVEQIEVGGTRNFTYTVRDATSGDWLVIDPHDGPELLPALEDAASGEGHLRAILLTHSHWDHCDGIGAVVGMARRSPDFEVLCHALELHRLKGKYALPAGIRQRSIRDGETLEWKGAPDLTVFALHLPGHSAGGCAFLTTFGTTQELFTGDTLFIRDCGRTDLETGDDAEMFRSLRRIAALHNSTGTRPSIDPWVLSGHHYARECFRRLSEELTDNAPLRARTLDELRAIP